MSLILEALRKSEAERRRGVAPDVAMELPPASAARTRAMPAWVLPVVLLGAIMLLAAWWSQRDASSANDEAPAIASPVAEPRIATPAQPVVVARPTQPVAIPQAAPSASTTSQPTPAIAEPTPPPARPLPEIPPASTPDIANIDATSLPPVKLSMHMWDESPSKRFVILNGQRMSEGDRNGDITVVAIERDGVVVERNGQRARVPLP